RLPPELRSGMTLDSRADVYSLAMLAVEMITGGVDRHAVDGPQPLKTVLGRALADDPMVRHTSVDALLHELDAALSGQAPKPRRPTPPVGVPVTRERVGETDAAAPRPDDVRPPSQETTRSIDPEELELLKGDQVTRQVPLADLISLRAASSETQQVPLEEMIVEDEESNYDELTLEQQPPPMAPPPSPPSRSHDSDELKTDQVHRLEPDAAKTTEHPRLPPPVIEDEIDTQRVTRADVHEMVAAQESAEERQEPHDPNATPLPPPMPQSTIMTPGAMKAPSETLAASKDVPTKVEGRGKSEPKIEISVELPAIGVAEAPRAAAAAAPSPSPGSPPVEDELLYDGDEAPTRTVMPDAIASPARPSASAPPAPVALPPATSAPSKPVAAAPSNVPTPIAPSASARRRRNPFDPLPPEEDARTTEHRSPPLRPSDVRGGDAPDARRRRPKPRPTMVVPPIGKRSSAAPVLLVALAAFIAAVGVALAISHYLTEQRLSDERREKQRLADELNAQAEALRHQQAPHADGGQSKAPLPVVTHPDAAPSMLPRQGACPLGAHLVTQGGHSFCVDVYEYPGGNTIPRTNVSLAEAGRICVARGERLCSEGEWERACRGKGGASYPYGQLYEAARCNTTGELALTGSFAACKSAVGAYDMSGNVAEWVASAAQKGGTAKEGAKESRCSAVTRGAPTLGGPLVGFRCCADPTGKH
ncbi:MAG: SUMF1/EgtB/PvdO family nonheme iron enzyme, partial [Myxococcales bacterium]|nr:SUMF1/EgtB/PvdO family nonheme iron enzyme [Myxococcales bacterium]